MKIVSALLTILALCASVFAEDDRRIPLISVTGTHELNVPPDEIEISISIENREKTLQLAKEKTDTQAKTLIALAKAHEVPAKDTITSYVAVKPVYSYRKDEGRRISYFQAGQRVTVTLHDFSKYDSLMDSLIKSGFSNTFVEYDLSNIGEYRKKARVSAIVAAQEKARLLAEAVGQKIGKAYSIKEIEANQFRNVLATANTVAGLGSPEEEVETSPLSVGNIPIKVTVEASFLLE